jgi:hypothetical protein
MVISVVLYTVDVVYLDAEEVTLLVGYGAIGVVLTLE